MKRDEALMAVRLLMQVVGGALLSQGIGSAAMWEQAAALAVIGAGYLWSRSARRKLRAQASLSGAIAAKVVGR